MKNLLYILLLMSVPLFFNCSNKDIDMRLTKAENNEVFTTDCYSISCM